MFHAPTILSVENEPGVYQLRLAWIRGQTTQSTVLSKKCRKVATAIMGCAEVACTCFAL